MTNDPSMYKMTEIPGGDIQLRDDRTKSQWKVVIKPFLMGIYPVTQALYRDVTNTSPSFFKGDSNPVETISWVEAVAFCNELSIKARLPPFYKPDKADESSSEENEPGFRLPTEAEWEHACRAGTSGVRYGNLEMIAWFKDNSEQKTHPVGLKEPNAWGLYDMLGNVWEWCSDIYDETTYGSYRIFRGGGWADNERGCLATNRRRSHPISFKIEDLGFRVARNIEQ